MKNTINQTMTHEAAELLREATALVKRYGTRDDEGNVNVRMSPATFARKFGHISDVRDAIDTLEANFDRIGFFLLPGAVQISLHVGR